MEVLLHDARAEWPQYLTAWRASFSGHAERTLLILIGADNVFPDPTLPSYREQPILPIRIDGSKIAAGPLRLPGRSTCTECLRYWLATANGGFRGATAAPSESALHEAMQLSIKFVHEYALLGTIARLECIMEILDVETAQLSQHAVYPRGNCLHCANIAASRPFELWTHCSSQTGIVSKVRETAETALGLYYASATFVSPLSRDRARPPLRARTAYGRGMSLEEARIGAVAEALERYSLVYCGGEPMVRAAMTEIAGIDPREILLFSERQYAERLEWNRTADDRYLTPEDFEPAQSVEWLPAVDLETGERAWAPAACCLMWYPHRDGESKFGSADTVGCGSGRTLEEAALHAIYEAIERDALAIWWYNRIRRPQIPSEEFADPRIERLREGLASVGRRLVLLDITTDIGIPAVVAIAARADGSEPIFASAANRSPSQAAWGAASEAVQIWSAIFLENCVDAELRRWLNTASVSRETYLDPAGTAPPRPEPEPLSLSAQIVECVQAFRATGLRCFLVDQSRPDVVLRTARVIIPGIRHVWNRRAPGRLYDVPVKLGWLAEPLREEDLNSICCMI